MGPNPTRATISKGFIMKHEIEVELSDDEARAHIVVALANRMRIINQALGIDLPPSPPLTPDQTGNL